MLFASLGVVTGGWYDLINVTLTADDVLAFETTEGALVLNAAVDVNLFVPESAQVEDPIIRQLNMTYNGSMATFSVAVEDWQGRPSCVCFRSMRLTSQ